MTPVDPHNVDPRNDDEFKVIEIQSTLTEAKKPESLILKEIEDSGYDEDSTFAIKLALEEAMTNAVRHGNCGDANKKVRVRYIVNPKQVTICVRDEGEGFRIGAENVLCAANGLRGVLAHAGAVRRLPRVPQSWRRAAMRRA